MFEGEFTPKSTGVPDIVLVSWEGITGQLIPHSLSSQIQRKLHSWPRENDHPATIVRSFSGERDHELTELRRSNQKVNRQSGFGEKIESRGKNLSARAAQQQD